MAVFVNAESVRKHASAILALGVVNVVLGAIALVFVGVTTLVSVAMLGALFVVAGLSEIVFGIRTREEGNLGYHVLMGLVAVVLGGFILANPVANAAGFTLLVGVLCLVQGAARALAVLFDGARDRGWVIVSGAVTAVVGLIVLSNWPSSALWTLGVFVGVEILTFGTVLMRIGIEGRRLAATVDRVESVPPTYQERHAS